MKLQTLYSLQDSGYVSSNDIIKDALDEYGSYNPKNTAYTLALIGSKDGVNMDLFLEQKEKLGELILDDFINEFNKKVNDFQKYPTYNFEVDLGVERNHIEILCACENADDEKKINYFNEWIFLKLKEKNINEVEMLSYRVYSQGSLSSFTSCLYHIRYLVRMGGESEQE